MHHFLATLERFTTDDHGQDLVEYGLLGSLIAVCVVVSVTAVGRQIFTTFWQVIGNAV